MGVAYLQMENTFRVQIEKGEKSKFFEIFQWIEIKKCLHGQLANICYGWHLMEISTPKLNNILKL